MKHLTLVFGIVMLIAAIWLSTGIFINPPEYWTISKGIILGGIPLAAAFVGIMLITIYRCENKQLIIFIVMISIIFTSCSGTRNGYGCHGRSKYITGYKN